MRPQRAVMMLTKNSSENLDSRASRAIETLLRWSARYDGVYAQQREHVRRSLNGRITVYLPDAKSRGGEIDDAPSIEVWVRDVSEGGLSFLYHAAIAEQQIIVALPMATGSTTFVQAEIVRRRQIHDGFWEYGVRFVRRAAV